MNKDLLIDLEGSKPEKQRARKFASYPRTQEERDEWNKGLAEIESDPEILEMKAAWNRQLKARSS